MCNKLDFIHPIQHNCCNFETNDAILKAFGIYNVLNLCNIVYCFLQFCFVGAVKTGEKENK